MIPVLKRALERLLPAATLRYRAYSNLVANQQSYLHATGWMKSLKERKPLDESGSPVPWMNYPTIRLLDERLKKDMSLFEFGSGYSTLFYAERVRTVSSVEYDRAWYDIIKVDAPANVNLIYQAKDVDGDYCRTIGATEQRYDIVVVDGRDRVNCVKQSFSTLSERGVIILDDSQRSRYKEASKLAALHGFRALGIEGLKPTGVDIDRTTVFYRDGNSLGL